jgi:hypothetical protein
VSASERRIAELEADLARTRRLLGQQMRTGESLEVEAIVNAEGVPLVNLRWDQLAAQMPVQEGREFAYQVLRVCEWATVDAEMLKALRKAGFDDATAGGFMAIMRDARSGQDESSATTKAGG